MVSEHLRAFRGAQAEHDQEGGLRLDRFFAVLKRHTVLIASITALTTAGAVAKSVTEKPTYQSRFELLTPPVTLETEIISTINPDALSNRSEAVGVGVLDSTQLKILLSPRVMEPIVARLQKTYPAITYGEVTRKLNITPNDDGKTLTVQYKSDDPEKVFKVLDVVSEAYLRYSLEDRQSDIYRGVDFVDEQLPIVRERVNELEAELEALRQSSNLIDPQLQGQQLSEQMARFTSEQLELRVKIQESEKLYQDLERELYQGEELAATSALLQSPRYQALLDQLLEVDSQLADELTLYLDGSPEIEVIAERRANIKPLLEREGRRVQEQVASVRRELDARDRALSDSIATLDDRIKRLSSTTRQYNSIQRDLEIAATNLNEFLTKREALRIDAAQRQTPWEILTPHGYPTASAGNTKLNFLLGGFLGLLLGTGAALIVDRMSDKVYSIKDLKEATQSSLLGTIPYTQLLENNQSLIVSRQPSERTDPIIGGYEPDQRQLSRPFLEAFRRLATNVKLHGSLDSQRKSLAVSSAVPNEGKSSVSLYLAHALSSLGYRTLLVDTDMRHPTLHRLCDVPNQKGLSNYLTGEVPLSDSLIALPTEENLFFIPSGPALVDPIKLLSSKKMEEFYQQIYKTFDMVIFDTPPLLGFADAFMTIKKTQGLLLTSRIGHVKFSQLQSALDELYVAKISTIGVVANCVKQGPDMTDGYSHYYEGLVDEMDETTQAEEVPVEFVNNIESNGNASWKSSLSNLLGR